MYILLGAVALLVLVAAFYFLSPGKGEPSNRSDADAQRFARLLVSEIKLYNESKVARGVQNNNLSDALRDEIAEARGRYNKRFASEDMRAYFDDALVEILADGDRSKLDSGIKSSFR